MQSNKDVSTTEKKKEDALVVKTKQPDSLVVKTKQPDALVAKKESKKAIINYHANLLMIQVLDSQRGLYQLDHWSFGPFEQFFKPGDFLVQVASYHPEGVKCIVTKPGSSTYFTTTDAFHSGNAYADMYSDLQIGDHPKYARKGFTMIYKIDDNFLKWMGHTVIGVAKTNNNPQYGEGGKNQYFISDKFFRYALATKLTQSIEYPTEKDLKKEGARLNQTMRKLEWNVDVNTVRIKSEVKYECVTHSAPIIALGHSSTVQDKKDVTEEQTTVAQEAQSTSTSSELPMMTGFPKVKTSKFDIKHETQIKPPFKLQEQKKSFTVTYTSTSVSSRTTDILSRLGGLRRAGTKTAVGALLLTGVYGLAKTVGAMSSGTADERIQEVHDLRAKTLANQAQEKELLRELGDIEAKLSDKLSKGTASADDKRVLQRIESELHPVRNSDEHSSSPSSTGESSASGTPSNSGMFSDDGIGSSYAAVGRTVIDTVSSTTSNYADRLANGTYTEAINEEYDRLNVFGV